MLFVETMLIRYIGSQTRILAFYKNIPLIGAVLGGWTEYATMATGIRFMAALALGLYAASALALIIATRRTRPEPTEA